MFCLNLQGHTRSSSRVWTAVRAGCVPVVSIHHAVLPFRTLIDYSQLLVRVHPRELQDARGFMAFLQAFYNSKRYAELRHNLQQYAHYFMWDTPWTCPNCTINPYVLTVAELLGQRRKQCNELETSYALNACPYLELFFQGSSSMGLKAN